VSLIYDQILVSQHSPRDGVTLDTVAVHWTAGSGDASTAARYFRTRHSFPDGVRLPRASYGYTLGRDSQIVQLVPDDRAAWHAGDGDGALWDGQVSGPRPGRRFNLRSIGVALCNAGPLPEERGGTPARHPKPGIDWRSYEPFPQPQIAALAALLAHLVTRHPTLQFVCGHEDITGGKGDPGPLFPWEALDLPSLGLRRVRRLWPGKTWV